MKQRYFISRHQSTELSEVIEFVIDQNNKHHKKNQEKAVPIEEVNLLVKEEASISDEDSRIYVARNQSGKIIGSIRTCRWNRKGQLPMQKLFGIDPQEIPGVSVNSQIWHVGRFAIDSMSGESPIVMFKQLMQYAITPIVEDHNAIMLAEIDSHLLKVMNLLGIKTHQLGHPVEYLGSLTIPIYSNKSDLLEYYYGNKKLISDKYDS